MASTYSAGLKARLREKGLPGFGVVRTNPPEWLVEKRYQEKLIGGYNKKNKCPKCFILKPTATQYCNNCED